MIETVLYNHIKTELASRNLSISPYFEVPANPPGKFIIIERTGGRADDHLLRSTFAFRSYAPTLAEAAALDEIVVDIVNKSVQQKEITQAKLNSHYNYTDTSTKKYRYQAVFDFVHY